MIRGGSCWPWKGVTPRDMNLVVSSLSPVLRGELGRNPGDKIEHDQAEIGVSVRVIGNGLGLWIARQMPNT